MNVIKQVKEMLFQKTEKERIIERLMQSKEISSHEAIILLRGETNINIKVDRVELSSGAKIFVGDDNETSSR